MITDEVTVYNLALDAVGTRSDVSLPTEDSREAEICRLWFAPVRDLVLRAAPWPSVKAYTRLALLKERDDTLAWVSTDPEPGFRYAYAAPSDFLYPRYMSGFTRFTRGVYQGQQVIYANEADGLLVYTQRSTNIALWDTDLSMAITLALAAHIAMPLHGKPGRAKLAQEQANERILQARVNAANDEVNTYDTMPEWITARGYGGGYPDTRYFYPYGPMISTAEIGAVS